MSPQLPASRTRRETVNASTDRAHRGRRRRRAGLEEERARWPLGYDCELGGEFEASAEANNAIVHIDRIQLEIDEHGLAPAKAVVEAAQTRLRPIMLTTATTVGGSHAAVDRRRSALLPHGGDDHLQGSCSPPS